MTTNYREINKEIVAEISKFQQLAANRNSVIGASLEKIILPLMEYGGPLSSATTQDLDKITHKTYVVKYLSRILRGEPIDQILRDVPRSKSGRTRLSAELLKIKKLQRAAETEEREGAYENGIRSLEERSY